MRVEVTSFTVLSSGGWAKSRYRATRDGMTEDAAMLSVVAEARKLHPSAVITDSSVISHDGPEITLTDIIETEIRVYLAHQGVTPGVNVRWLAGYMAERDWDPYEHTDTIDLLCRS